MKKVLVCTLITLMMLASLVTVVFAQNVPTNVHWGTEKGFETYLFWNKVEGMALHKITLYKNDEVVDKIFFEGESDSNELEVDLWDLIESHGWGRYTAVVEAREGTFDDFDDNVQINKETEIPMSVKSEMSTVFQYVASFKYTGSMFGGDEDDILDDVPVEVVETNDEVFEEIPAPVVTSTVPSVAGVLPTPQIVKISSVNNSLFTVIEEVDDFSIGQFMQTIQKTRTKTALTPVDEYTSQGDKTTDYLGNPIVVEHKYYDGYTAKDIHQISFETSPITEEYYNRAMFFNKTSATSPHVIGVNTFYNYGYVQLFSEKYEAYDACYNPFSNILYIFPGDMSSIDNYGTALLKIDDKVYKVQFKPTLISVLFDGQRIGFDQLPVIENGRTLVPLRAIFEKIGATVEWDGATQTVTATKDDTTVSLTIYSTTAYKNGQAIALDVPAKIINGRTLVPVRFVSDCFGVGVEWNSQIQSVILTSK